MSTFFVKYDWPKGKYKLIWKNASSFLSMSSLDDITSQSELTTVHTKSLRSIVIDISYPHHIFICIAFVCVL